MSGMDDLIAFLAARYAEAEATAVAAAADAQRMAGRAHWTAEDSIVVDAEDADRAIADLTPWVEDASLARHVAATDPAHRLRDITLKRAILADHSRYVAHFGPSKGEPCCSTCGAVADDPYLSTPWPCDTIRHLATEFSDHPDYKQEWAAS